jgi:pyridoxal phosphate enzyme (YggS family)
VQIEKNLHTIKQSIPPNVTLIAVTKTKPVTLIEEAYNCGHKDFGENKIQEMVEKYNVLPKDINWHMIGHLQTNKIKYMAHFVYLIHGVDSFKKLEEINKQALKHNRVINCLLQIKIASEETKFGMKPNEVESLLQAEEFLKLNNIVVKGFMGMASFTDNEQQIRNEFNLLKNIFNNTKKFTSLRFVPTILSMGMSSDYKIAIEEGSTMVRIGSAIFGERNYN